MSIKKLLIFFSGIWVGIVLMAFSLQFTAVEVPIVVREAKCTLACAATPTVKPKLCERADKAMGLFVVADNLCSISTIKDCYFKGISGEDIDFVKSNLTRLCK